MSRRTSMLLFALVLLPACADRPLPPDLPALAREVEETERAFARTMADRDHDAFASFLSEEAVFVSGPTPLRGKRQVAAWWKRYYEDPEAPFSWEPERVEVLDSGGLALTTGPVRDPEGKVVATFTSIWRRDGPETWRIVFDKGDEVCDRAAPVAISQF